MRWTIRERHREPVGTVLAFVTRSCCGPDGVGECIAAARGLACGVAEVPDYGPPPRRAERLRRLRIDLGLSLRAAAQGVGMMPVELSGVERGTLDVEEWEALIGALHEAANG